MLVFLGGTCGNNKWRDGFIARMTARGYPRSWFWNPIVKVWDAEAQRREDAKKRSADVIFFYIGDPQQPGNPQSFYSWLEALMAQYDSERCVAVFDLKGLKGHALKTAQKALQDLRGRFPYAPIFTQLSDGEDWLARNLLRRPRARR